MANKKKDINEYKMIRMTLQIVPPEMIEESKRADFNRNVMAVNMYVDGYTLNEITKETGVKSSNVGRLVERCFASDENGNVIGYLALVPKKHIVPSKDSDQSNSMRGAFQKLLCDYPELKDIIAGHYFGKKEYTLERVMNKTSLHEIFLDACKSLQISDERYPFNTTDRAYVSLCKYVGNLEKEDIAGASRRLSKDDRQKLLSTGHGEKKSFDPLAPYSVIQVDGHKIDIIYTTKVKLDDGTTESMICSRCWVFVIIDVATRCILGYSVSQEFNYNQYDVIRALMNSILPHKRINFTINGYEYPENGGFPNMAFPELEYALIDTVMLDNAKSHLSLNVMEKVVDQLNGITCFGPVSAPESRAFVERFFRTLEEKGFHRLPMTTDSNPRGLKRRNPEIKAVRYNVNFDQICEVVEQMFIYYNNSPHSSLYNKTPLMVMKTKIREYGMMPTIATGLVKHNVENLSRLIKKARVCGGKNGIRPYINFMNARYRCDKLSSNNVFSGKSITVWIDPEDVSTLEAYAENGNYIGTLIAVGQKGKLSHSLKMRQRINKHERENKVGNTTMANPITMYQKHLEENAKKSKRARTNLEILNRQISSKDVNKNNDVNEIEEKPDLLAEVENINPEDMLGMDAREIWERIKKE